MIDNHSNNEETQRTVRPQQVLERTARPNLEPMQMQMAQHQQQAAGKTCPYCGAVNEPEAMFCAQCGQPISKTICPHCGAEIDPDADFCESCHHYIKKDVCSFCGSHLSGNEAYCPECGSPRGGIVCPTCHTLNEFAFCKKCGTALTEEARMMVKQLQMNPDYQELLEIVRDYSKLENALPYNSERDIVREQMSAKLRERVLTLLAKDEGVEIPVIPKVESKRMTRDELEEQKAVKIKMLSAILDKLAVAPTSAPVKARNYAMASKPVGVRLAWVCNYKHAMHSSPCGCAKPHMGGKWVVLGKNSTDEIKDDK
ncbi:MAG: zinc-ribbon domain-containing protein [Prevotella sp.]|nr:zinc-ribbon domain-containing protein [Prevotella sp.]MBQ2673404.1 zinc ribbon domain-containing protein [Prevotella sp.]